MNRFIEFCLQFGNLNQQQIELISKKHKLSNFKKSTTSGKQVNTLNMLVSLLRAFKEYIITTTWRKRLPDIL